jgi:hypothetical protein
VGAKLNHPAIDQRKSNCAITGRLLRHARQTFAKTYAAFFVAAFLPPVQIASGQVPRPGLIEFKSGDLELKGFVWKPSGDGPFPAILWNHGSGKTVEAMDSVTPYFISKGYVFLRPA